MQVRSIKNPSEFVSWNVKASKWPMKGENSRSKIQNSVGQILREKFPYDPILEDITIPQSRLSLDFFIPHRKIAIEVQGSQHDEFNSFFHSTKAAFHKQKQRDSDKRSFCEMNNITLIEVRNIGELKEALDVC